MQYVVVCVLLVLFAFAALAVVAMPDEMAQVQAPVLNMVLTDHAKTSHAAQLSQIDACFMHGKLSPWRYNPSSNRWMQYCEDGTNKNGFRIAECKNGVMYIITQFPQKAKGLARYLSNSGYQEVEHQPDCS